MYNCIIDNANCIAMNISSFAKGAQNEHLGFLIEGCVFKNTTGSRYAVICNDVQVGGIFKNCIFYNNTQTFNLNSPNITFLNNVFHSANTWVMYCYDNEYSGNPLNRYNIFTGLPKEEDYFFSDTVGFSSTDRNTDPQFKDVAYGDFSLLPTSPCLNKGMATIGNGHTSIGAWQGYSIVSDCNKHLDMDFNNDCKVNFADFRVIASAWLTREGQAEYQPRCDIALPYDGIVNEKDFEIFIDNWLIE